MVPGEGGQAVAEGGKAGREKLATESTAGVAPALDGGHHYANDFPPSLPPGGLLLSPSTWEGTEALGRWREGQGSWSRDGSDPKGK